MSVDETNISKVEKNFLRTNTVKTDKFYKKMALGFTVPLILVFIWQLLSNLGLIPSYLLPSPLTVVTTLIKLSKTGELFTHAEITTYRVLVGFTLGSIVAIFLGSITGYYRAMYQVLDPLIQALRAIPSLAWVPLFILWFGIGEGSKVIMIAVGVFFPVYLNWVTGIKGVDKKYVEVGILYHFTAMQTIKKILFPAALPSLLTGLRSGLGLGWMFVVAAELMGTSKGLGYLMVLGENNSAPELIIGSIILFAILGKITDGILVYIERRVLHWQDSFGKESRNVSS